MATTQQRISAFQADSYYVATAGARVPGVGESLRDAHQRDLLELCRRGAWSLELHQFMPPASLRESVERLVELGLIERVDDPPATLPLDHQRGRIPARHFAANEAGMRRISGR